MKEYFEKILNPKSGQYEKTKIEEYCFEDWERGFIGAFKTGATRVRNIDTGIVSIILLRKNEYDKIIGEQKKLYKKKIELEFDILKRGFLLRYKKSENTEALVNKEISIYNKLLFDETLKLFRVDLPSGIKLRRPVFKMPNIDKMHTKDYQLNPNFKNQQVVYYQEDSLTQSEVVKIREIYDKIIINGEKDYSKTKSPKSRIGSSDQDYIKVEAINKYRQFLKDLIANNHVDSSLNNRIKKYYSFLKSYDLRKNKIILNEKDYDKLLNWLYFFYSNNFSIPEINEPIQQVNTGKTNLIYSLKDFFKKEYPTSPYPESLSVLFSKMFYQFRDYETDTFLKTSKPKYYDEFFQ